MTELFLRRATSTVIFLTAFLGLGILSFLGNHWLSAIFIVTAGVVVVRHAVSLCPQCTNYCCGFNPRLPKISPEELSKHQSEGSAGFSNLPITRTTVLPLLLTGPLAVIGAWLFSPIATIALVGVIFIAHHVFTKITCSGCENNCVGNCNENYRTWKKAEKRVGS